MIQNRKARFNYQIEDTMEAGLVLKGTEVKSIRAGEAALTDGYITLRDDEAWLVGMYVKAYAQGSYLNHDERRDRKLLLHKRELRELDKAIDRKGMTIVPLKLYFKGGVAKLQIGIARGKKVADKRSTIKERDDQRETDRSIKKMMGN